MVLIGDDDMSDNHSVCMIKYTLYTFCNTILDIERYNIQYMI